MNKTILNSKLTKQGTESLLNLIFAYYNKILKDENSIQIEKIIVQSGELILIDTKNKKYNLDSNHELKEIN